MEYRPCDCQNLIFFPSYNRHRLKLYSFMLEHMSDEQRFQITAKICTEVKWPPTKRNSSKLIKASILSLVLKIHNTKIYFSLLNYMYSWRTVQHMSFDLQILGGVVDNVIALDDKSSALLKDALAILSCKVRPRTKQRTCNGI